MVASEQTMINKEAKKVNGVVYTPVNFAEYVAEKLIQYYLRDQRNLVIKKKIKIIDPSCGDGELLIAIQKSLAKKNSLKNSSKVIIHSAIYGIDIDREATNKAKKRLKSSAQMDKNLKFFQTSALFPFKRDTIVGWKMIKKESGTLDGFDILIANPPWGADLKLSRNELDKSSFILKKGQFDSSDLFIELALSVVKQNGYFAFIVPDALFNGGKKDLREMLVKQTEIKFIGRFGEKIFKNINMACAVIICKNATPSFKNKVNCFHLTPILRKKIMSREIDFSDAEKTLSHIIFQSRFKNNKDFLLNIDTQENDQIISHTSNKNFLTIGDYLTSSRGVELSKSGKICRCKKCQLWMPVPTSSISRCIHCKATVILDEAEVSTIISEEKIKGSIPLLVGESIKRYAISSRYWINMENRGINYKDISIYHHPKILVRKTGVGITATIDYSQSITNQVVYIFRPKSQSKNSPPLELFLAIINSRVMYYQLAKKYGETEWRSHPYLTQKQVLDLPLPNLDTNIAKTLWEKVSSLLKPYLRMGNGIPSRIDAKIESYMAQLYDLSINDYDQIFKTLNSNQNLLPVRALKQISTHDIFSVS